MIPLADKLNELALIRFHTFELSALCQIPSISFIAAEDVIVLLIVYDSSNLEAAPPYLFKGIPNGLFFILADLTLKGN